MANFIKRHLDYLYFVLIGQNSIKFGFNANICELGTNLIIKFAVLSKEIYLFGSWMTSLFIKHAKEQASNAK